MKRLGRVLGSLLAVALTVASLQAVAAETQSGGRDFNHMSTGFPLSGGHAIAACETCHMGGVFKGTPRTCAGCHAVGGRVVATPKSNTHIVTDAPCETCHFNTSTWLGARYNHGTARRGECISCHNGRISTGKHSGHVPTTYSCDSCHRTSSWIPASWNHTDTTSDCVTCHKAGGPGRNYSASHMNAAVMGAMGLNSCRSCHKSYYSFYGAFYDHAGASFACDTCHKNPAYPGVKQMPATAIHTITMPSVTCRSCHKSYALGSFPAASYDHVGASPACETCHANNATYGAAGVKQLTSTKHTVYAAVGITNCQSCHTSFAVGSFPTGRYNHAGAGACQSCHTAAYSPTIRAMSAKHIPIPVTATCTGCHTSPAAWSVVARGAALHNQVAGTACYVCHGSNTAYPGNGQRTASWPSFHKASRNPAATDCSASGCHAPIGSKGSAYTVWD